MTDPQTALLDAISDHVGLVQSVSYELTDLSSAAYALGQDRLADRLAQMAEALPKSAKEVSRAHGKALNDTAAASEQATFNMIHATIAGIGLGARSALTGEKQT